MSIFVIKIIACVTMVLDHVKYAMPETRCFATEYLGRISFPLFAFLIGEGYAHTSNLKRYYKRLILFALVSQIPFMLFRTLVGEWRMLNILFTLLLGLLAITIFDKLGSRYYLSIPAVIAIIYVGKLVNVDYSWYGVAMVFLLFLCRSKKYIRILVLALLNLIYYKNRLFLNFSWEHLMSYISATLPACILLFYNGELGRKTKYGYYIFYPVHMLILYGLSKFCL